MRAVARVPLLAPVKIQNHSERKRASLWFILTYNASAMRCLSSSAVVILARKAYLELQWFWSPVDFCSSCLDAQETNQTF